MTKSKKLTIVFVIMLSLAFMLSALMMPKKNNVVNAATATIATVDGLRYGYGSGSTVTLYGHTGDLPSELIIPSSVTIQGNNYTVTDIALFGGDLYNSNLFANTSITKVVIPDSIRFIGSLAFFGCTNLVEATIGSGWNSITDSNSTFHGCTSLRTLTIRATTPVYDYFSAGSGSNKIGLLSMNNLKLGDVIYAAAGDYDSSVICAVDGTNTALEHIYVPAESVNAYKTAPGYSAFADIIEAIPQSGGSGNTPVGTGISTSVLIPSFAIITLGATVFVTTVVKKKKRI